MPRKKRANLSPVETEVEAYVFIRDHLKSLGWDVRNPTTHPQGRVWTQNQCHANPEIKNRLGATRPENIVKLSETRLWVIEAKRSRTQLSQAIREAELDYARPIMEGKVLSVPLISGVAGNETSGYEIRTKLLVGDKYQEVTINSRAATGLLDPATVDILLETGCPDIADLHIDENTFLRAAEHINKTLHLGGINKNDRAKVMAALLLALLVDPGPDVDSDLPILIEDINTRSKAILRKEGKVEFHPFVQIQPPTNIENHVKYKAALVQTIQELKNLSIKSAMNSGADVLGKFYEVFLKYGNGAKEIGIVLTPRHITKFGVEVLGVSPTDVVLDPACGTGGFLVAAFDHVRSRSSLAQLDAFKRAGLFGIEQESAVAALAIVNMIFRGDGKNHITEANCFSTFLRRSSDDGHPSAKYIRTPPQKGDEGVTRVLMNPPFALKKSDEKESRFVEVALQSMADNGLLLAVVPMSVMSEGGQEGGWRRQMLAHNTLISVVSLPEELFYPVANQTVILILKKGVSHNPDNPVLWARAGSDGFRKVKGKRLPAPDTPNAIRDLQPIVRDFVVDPRRTVKTVPELVRASPIDFGDPILELVPEAYLESHVPSSAELGNRLDRQVRETIAALVHVDLKYGIGHPTIIDTSRGAEPASAGKPGKLPPFKRFRLDSLFGLHAGDYHSLGKVRRGSIPVVSCKDTGNGIIGSYSIPAESVYHDALTIAFNGRPLTTKIHPYAFGAKDDVAVAVPRETWPPEVLVFLAGSLNAERWRFSYYRKCFREKLGRFEISLPAKGGVIHTDYMQQAVRAQPYWWFLQPRLKDWSPGKR